jgi:hypothetical protein
MATRESRMSQVAQYFAVNGGENSPPARAVSASAIDSATVASEIDARDRRNCK